MSSEDQAEESKDQKVDLVAEANPQPEEEEKVSHENTTSAQDEFSVVIPIQKGSGRPPVDLANPFSLATSELMDEDLVEDPLTRNPRDGDYLGVEEERKKADEQPI